MFPTNPVGQGRQASSVVGQPAKLAFDVVAAMIQVFPELVFQQGHRTQSTWTMLAMPQTGLRSFAFRYQLMSRTQGKVVKRITVVRLVPEKVAAPVESRDQTGGHLGFTPVQRGNFPGQGQRRRAVDRVQLVALGVTTARSTPRSVGVFAVASDQQRLSIHHFHPVGLPQLHEVFFHNVQQPLDFGGSQSTTHGRLRGQLFSGPQAVGPVVSSTRPAGGTLMQRCPHKNHHDLEVKDSGPVSLAPNDPNPHQSGIMPTRVRVPCLVSLKKGSLRACF